MANPLHPANIAMGLPEKHDLTTFKVTLFLSRPISSSLSRLCSCDVVLGLRLGRVSLAGDVLHKPSFQLGRGMQCIRLGPRPTLDHWGPQHRPTRIVSLDVTDRLESLSSHQQCRCSIIFHRFSEGHMRKSCHIFRFI